MSIADFLFSSSVQKILRIVYAEPNSSFMITRLIEHAGTGRGNGQRQIEALLKAGILREGTRQGRQRTIGANTEFPLYPELRSIYRKSFGLLEPLREALAPFAQQISQAFVFGSVAKSNDHHRSDIDLMVIGNPPLLDVLDALLRVEEIVGRPVHLNMYTREEWADLMKNDPVVANISADSMLEVYPNAETG
jgi:predicted nucleotidyltransferase